MRRGWLLLLLLIGLLFAGGCWDRQELNERALVLALGIDRAANGDVFLTTQIAIPAQIGSGPSGGTGGTGSGGGATGPGAGGPVWVISIEGRNVDDAIEHLQRELENPVFFGHLRVIVLGAELARQGTVEALDYFRRNPEVRRLVWLAVARGDAREALIASPPSERIPALYLSTLFDQAVTAGRLPRTYLGRFWIYQSAQGQESVAPLIEVNGNRITLGGLARFRGDRMAGVIDGTDMDSYLQLLGVKRGDDLLFIPSPHGDGEIGIRIFTRRASITPRFENGRLSALVKLRMEGDVEAEEIGADLDDPALLRQVEERATATLRRNIETFIAKMKGGRTDVIGFGEHVRAKLPAVWREIETKEAWQERFAHLPIELRLQFEVRRIGMESE